MISKRVKKIPLTQGKFALVDEEDYEYLMQWKWYYAKGYAVRMGSQPKRVAILMHRIVLERMGFKDFESSDHINRQRFDNRRANLRPVSLEQNNMNRGKQKNNTSGYMGVSWHKQGKKWRVRFRADGKYRSLGLFDDKKEAALAYNEAAKKCHGEFAVLNKVK
jgi:hypothetical protein